MNRLLAVLLVLVSVAFLSACGTVAQPTADLTTLEVQVVSSELDSTPIEYVEVRNSAGVVVASVRDSINRLAVFELPRGDYIVSAQIRGYKGTVSMERSVVLGGNTSTLLDLSESAHYSYSENWYGEGVTQAARLYLSEGASRFDESIDLSVETGRLVANYQFDRDLITAHNLVVERDQWGWTFTPRQGVTHSGSIVIRVGFEVTNCITFLGTYEISWYGEGVSKRQVLIDTPLCTKG